MTEEIYEAFEKPHELDYIGWELRDLARNFLGDENAPDKKALSFNNTRVEVERNWNYGKVQTYQINVYSKGDTIFWVTIDDSINNLNPMIIEESEFLQRLKGILGTGKISVDLVLANKHHLL